MEYRCYDDLPMMLSVPELAKARNISRAGADELVHKEGFPSLKIGLRIVIPKEKLLARIGENTSK